MGLLAHLVGDDTKIALVRLLEAAPGGLAQRELARRVGRDPAYVHRVLQALDATGLVDAHTDPRAVTLDRESPLHGPVIETIVRFEKLDLQTPLLRFTVRAAKARFGDAFYVGGYQVAAKVVQPIDFISTRVDLYAKHVTTKDRAWVKQLGRLVPFDVRLHPTERFSDVEESSLDGEPCWTASPERAALQCLEDATFPRYGAYLLLVQGLAEGAYDATTLARHASDDRIVRMVHAVAARVQGVSNDLPHDLDIEDRMSLKAAIETVEGHP